jgi:putative DNA primase/helicase
MDKQDTKRRDNGTSPLYDYTGIPPGMKENGKFCLYRIEQKKGHPKSDKVPYRRDGSRLNPGDAYGYMTFEEANAVYLKGGYAGIGIGCFNGIGMVDVDGCVVDGKLDERGQDIVDKLDSYTELSPSGTGIHIFSGRRSFPMTGRSITSTIVTPTRKSMSMG